MNVAVSIIKHSFSQIRNIVLLSSLLIAFTSCSGQTTSSKQERNIRLEEPTLSIGKNVTALDSTILYVVQDSRNDFWFGSNGQGIYRYNGKNLIQFTTSDGLPSNQIRGIQEDKGGNILVNTNNGISKIDGKSFTTLPVKDGSWQLRTNDLWFSAPQDSGLVYRYDGTTLYRLSFPKTQAYKDFVAQYPRSEYPQMNFNPYDVYGIHKDRKGNMWFGTNIGLCRYDGQDFEWMTEAEIGINAISVHVRSIIEDRKGKFWFTNLMHRFDIYSEKQDNKKNGTIHFRKEKGIIESKDHNAAYFLSGLEAVNGDLWSATYNDGVWRYDGKKLIHYELKDGLKNILLFTIYQDHRGELWLGTHNAGVYRFNGKTFVPFKI